MRAQNSRAIEIYALSDTNSAFLACIFGTELQVKIRFRA